MWDWRVDFAVSYWSTWPYASMRGFWWLVARTARTLFDNIQFFEQTAQIRGWRTCLFGGCCVGIAGVTPTFRSLLDCESHKEVTWKMRFLNRNLLETVPLPKHRSGARHNIEFYCDRSIQFTKQYCNCKPNIQSIINRWRNKYSRASAELI